MTLKIQTVLIPAALVLAALLDARGDTLYDNLNQTSLAGEFYSPINATAWAAQGFFSGSASTLTSVALNLFIPGVTGGSGTYFVRLYRQDGALASPGTLVATLGSGQSIAALPHGQTTNAVTLGGLSQSLLPGTDYYISVGGESGASNFAWGFTASTAGTGVVASGPIFTDSLNGGTTWRPVDFVDPQRMQVMGSVTVSRPRLQIRNNGGKADLSWATNSIGFQLQQAASLSASAIWNDVTNAPTTAGQEFHLLMTPADRSGFFRLIKP